MSERIQWRHPIAVVDLETTGLSHVDGDRVVEVAIIRMQDIHDPNPVRFNSLVNPSIPIPLRSHEIHGISDEMVSDAPSFADLAPSIAALLEGAVFVAHNAGFDLGFLKHEFERIGTAMPVPVATIDTLRLARNLYSFPSCSLGALASRMQLGLKNHHRALADADAALQALQCMLAEVDIEHTESVDTLLAHIEQMRKGGAQRKQIKRTLLQAARSKNTVEIGYTDAYGSGSLLTTRRITVERIRNASVEAWCHLRSEQRVFRLDRIQRVETEALPL